MCDVWHNARTHARHMLSNATRMFTTSNVQSIFVSMCEKQLKADQLKSVIAAAVECTYRIG